MFDSPNARKVKSVSCSFDYPDFHKNCTRRMSHCDCACHIKYEEKEFSVATYKELIRTFVVETWDKTGKKDYLKDNQGSILGIYSAITYKCLGIHPEVTDFNLFWSVVEETCLESDYSMFRYEESVEKHFGSTVPTTREVLNY